LVPRLNRAAVSVLAAMRDGATMYLEFLPSGGHLVDD
jgi:hypothetical protein